MTKNKKENKSIIALANKELDIQLSDSSVMRALIATTFNGFRDQLIVKQACLEAMMRGYSFQDILSKKIYAIPFKGSYALVQSIADVRAIAMKSGQVGKSEPIYVEDDKGNIVSCSVTVKKKIGDTIGEYTAKVFFNEYNTGYNQWKLKPRTMIAKVAEMHANRMAFPEVLHQSYIEGEFADNYTKEKKDNASELLKKKNEKTVKESKKESVISKNKTETKTQILKSTELQGKVIEGEIEEPEIEVDKKKTMTIDEINGEVERIKKMVSDSKSKEDDIVKFYEVESLEKLTTDQAAELMKILKAKIASNSSVEVEKVTTDKEAEKGIPGDVCEYLNKIRDIDESELPGDIMLLKLDSNKGTFRGYDAYPSLNDEMKKY